MSINQIFPASAITPVNRTTVQSLISANVVQFGLFALFTLSILFITSAAIAANPSKSTTSRYQAERAACISGQSNQDRATCLKEAGAALMESRKGRLNGNSDTYDQNALNRCQSLPANDRDACQSRIKGEGATSGSVESGGILRELTVPDNK